MRLPPARPPLAYRVFHLPTGLNSIPRVHSKSLNPALWTVPLQDRSELSWAVPSAGVSRHSRRSRISRPPFFRAGSAFALGAFHKNITAVYQPPARARALTLRPLVRRSSCRRHSEVTPPQAVICHNSGDSCGLSAGKPVKAVLTVSTAKHPRSNWTTTIVHPWQVDYGPSDEARLTFALLTSSERFVIRCVTDSARARHR